MLMFIPGIIHMKYDLVDVIFNTFYDDFQIYSWTQAEFKFYWAMLMVLLDCLHLNLKPMQAVLLVKLCIV